VCRFISVPDPIGARVADIAGPRGDRYCNSNSVNFGWFTNVCLCCCFFSCAPECVPDYVGCPAKVSAVHQLEGGGECHVLRLVYPGTRLLAPSGDPF